MIRRFGGPGMHGAGGVPLSALGGKGQDAAPWWNPDGATPAANTGAWLAKGAADLAESYLNLGLLGHADINPAVVGGVAPTLGPNGWTFTVAQYLETGIQPAAGLACSALVQFSGAAGTDGHLFGASPWGSFSIAPQRTGLTRVIYFRGGFNSQILPSLASGNLALAGGTPYRNGGADGAPFGGGINPTADIWLNCTNNAGVPLEPLGCVMTAFVFYDMVLTAPQIAARYAAMAAL